VITVRIDGYLVHRKLEDALKTIVGETAWRGNEVPLIGRKQRWDMLFEINGARVAVEFDGDEHYRNTLKIKAGTEKDESASASG
jgi:hypothetical protein